MPDLLSRWDFLSDLPAKFAPAHRRRMSLSSFSVSRSSTAVSRQLPAQMDISVLLDSFLCQHSGLFGICFRVLLEGSSVNIIPTHSKPVGIEKKAMSFGVQLSCSCILEH